MGKFNTSGTRSATGRGPIGAEATPSARTSEGGAGYVRSTKSELFLLAVSNMCGEPTFYESAGNRDSRYTQLVREVAAADPAWTGGFLRWLRGDGGMRSASLVGALEAAKALNEAKIPGGRQIVDSVLRRADEPGEALAYWTSRYGRTVPKPIKRGIADAARRLYSQFTLLKYDTASHGVRFADVLDLTHPTAGTPEQGALYRFAIDRRHGHDDVVPETLPMVAYNAKLRAGVAAGDYTWLLSPAGIREAGMTWEDVLSLAGPNVDKARLWTALIPNMGYMALIRNLRNLDESGVPDDVALGVGARLADPDEVARSRQFPMRFLSAYKAVQSLRWGHFLEQAVNHSLANVPRLPGRTLILVDVSGSMSDRVSAKSELNRAETAGIFASALALRSDNPTLVWFNHSSGRVDVPKGGALLRLARSIPGPTGSTYTAAAVQRWYAGHDRVIVITDEQYTSGSGWYGPAGDPSNQMPKDRPMYTWNLAGYRTGSTPTTANRFTFGGLTDAGFRITPLVEAGRNATWPWETQAD
jgi:hypothetical protein